MKHRKHQQNQNREFLDNFPFDIYPQIWPNQENALLIIGRDGSVLLELPTGSGKTVTGHTGLRTLQRSNRRGRFFYIVPTKTLVDQVHQLHPDTTIIYGRNEYPCLYYEEAFPADEVPCSLLTDCPHRVDQQTGRTRQRGYRSCPYLRRKYEARQGGIVVCTVSFYLFTHLFNPQDWPTPDGLVIDEVHKLAKIVRNSLSYEISDYHLRRAVRLMNEIGANEEAETFGNFLSTMTRIIRRRRRRNARRSTLLESDELMEMIEILERVDEGRLNRRVRTALSRGQVDPREHREVLRRIEIFIHDVRRYIRSLGFSLSTGDRNPLNYVYCYWREELVGNQRVQYNLHIKSYYVRPVISRRLLSPFTLSMSATIGDPDVLGFETGIVSPFHTFPSSFPVDNARIFLPTDTPNLALNARSRQQPTRVIRSVTRACRRFAENGIRSLVMVVSNRELDNFLLRAEEEGVNAVSYRHNGSTARQATESFRNGNGDVLAGTVANYGEGIDLPRQMAPVIFFLRPGYPNPNDPATIFEERRYGRRRWAIWNWRVMIEALQVRGRNIRGPEDVGVTFFISQQFRRFLFPILPEWLQDAYRGEQIFDQCIEEAEQLLLRRRRRRRGVRRGGR